MNNYRAVIVGATGMVGRNTTLELLQSQKCQHVVSLGRRNTDIFQQHPNSAEKLTQHVIDINKLVALGKISDAQFQEEKKVAELEELLPLVNGAQVAFCTLGIGQPSKAKKSDVYDIDVHAARGFARLCKAGGVKHISLLGSCGADKNSSLYYLKVKGEAEEALYSQNFERVSLFRPSLLQTKETRYGFMDSINQAVFPKISWMFPKKYHEIKVEDLGKAMVRNAEQLFHEKWSGPAIKVPGVEALTYAEFMSVLNP